MFVFLPAKKVPFICGKETIEILFKNKYIREQVLFATYLFYKKVDKMQYLGLL